MEVFYIWLLLMLLSMFLVVLDAPLCLLHFLKPASIGWPLEGSFFLGRDVDFSLLVWSVQDPFLSRWLVFEGFLPWPLWASSYVGVLIVWWVLGGCWILVWFSLVLTHVFCNLDRRIVCLCFSWGFSHVFCVEAFTSWEFFCFPTMAYPGYWLWVCESLGWLLWWSTVWWLLSLFCHLWWSFLVMDLCLLWLVWGF